MTRETGLVVATLIGVAFGFVLERAGFGRAPKLAAQFYGTDLTVLKVMFGAIVTALLGMVLLSGAGVVDFKAVADEAASATFLWPMLAGGLALGVGFIVSGYCPGTSFVAAASGKLDGLAVVAGVIAGQVAYAEVETLPPVAKFHASGDLGHKYLWELVGLPATSGPAVIAVAVVAMAVTAFVASDRLVPAGVSGARRGVFAGFATAAVLGVLALTLPRQVEAHVRQPAVLTQLQLATRLVDEPWKLRIVDVRAANACIESRVPGAECVPLDRLAALGLADAAAARDLVLIDDVELSSVPGAAAAYRGRIFTVLGGYQGWREFALAPPAPLAPDASPRAREVYLLRSAIHAAMTGAKAAPPPPPPTAAPPGAPRKGGGGCGS